VVIWCLAVAKAAPSVGYFRFPLTGHLESLSMASLMGFHIIGYQLSPSKSYRMNCSNANKPVGTRKKSSLSS